MDENLPKGSATCDAEGGDVGVNLFLKGFGYNAEESKVAALQDADYSNVVLCPDALEKAVDVLVPKDPILRQVLWDGDELNKRVSFTWGFPALFAKLREKNPGVVLTSRKLYDKKKIDKSFGGELSAYSSTKIDELKKEYPDLASCPPRFQVLCNPDCTDYTNEASDMGVPEDSLKGWKLLGQVSLRQEEAPKIVLSQGGGVTVKEELEVAARMGTESTWYVLYLKRPHSPKKKDEDGSTKTFDKCIKTADQAAEKKKEGDATEEAKLIQEVKLKCPWNEKYESPSDWSISGEDVAPGYLLKTEEGSIVLPDCDGGDAKIGYRKYSITPAASDKSKPTLLPGKPTPKPKPSEKPAASEKPSSTIAASEKSFSARSTIRCFLTSMTAALVHLAA